MVSIPQSCPRHFGSAGVVALWPQRFNFLKRERVCTRSDFSMVYYASFLRNLSVRVPACGLIGSSAVGDMVGLEFELLATN